jgi:hypothetical protein
MKPFDLKVRLLLFIEIIFKFNFNWSKGTI